MRRGIGRAFGAGIARGPALTALTALTALLLLTACSGSASPAGGGAAVTEISGPMPSSLAGETLRGVRLDPADLEGKIVVVNFWATWCGPCRREQPALSDVYERRKDGTPPVAFVGVNYRDDAAAARAYLEEFEVEYPSLSDPAGSLAYDFGVPFLPSTIVIDSTARMRYRAVGEVDADQLEELIDRVAGSPDGA